MYWHQVGSILLLTSQFTVLIINYLCALDTTLRVLITWYKLHVMNYISDTSTRVMSHSTVLTWSIYSILFRINSYYMPKRGLIHQDRKSSDIRPPLYLQATTAELNTKNCSESNLLKELCTPNASQNMLFNVSCAKKLKKKKKQEIWCRI